MRRRFVMFLVRLGYVGKRARHKGIAICGHEAVISEGRFIAAKWEGDSVVLRYLPDGSPIHHARPVDYSFVSHDPVAKMWAFRD